MTPGDYLLQHIVQQLQLDSRVAAAWLAGSRGRGTNDAHSDIDIWVALRDSEIDAVNADPHAFVQAIVPTVMHMLAPEISPAGGSFLGSWVEWGGSFEQVDWYFTPFDKAQRPPATNNLFGEVPVVSTRQPDTNPAEQAQAMAVANLKLALQMTNNMIKHGVRGDSWRAIEHARHADACLRNASWLRAERRKPTFAETAPSWLTQEVPSQPRDFARLAHHLVNAVESSGADSSHELLAACKALRSRICQLSPEEGDPT